MTLLEYMKERQYYTVTAQDDQTGVSVRFYLSKDSAWETAKLAIASKLEVVMEIGSLAVVNFSEVIKNSWYELEKDGLFKDAYHTEKVMKAIPFIFDHNVSIVWFQIFAMDLKKVEI